MHDTNITQLKQDNRFKGIFSSFTKKYSLSKTIRFELKPLPETKKFLSEFITADIQRDKDYQELKRIIDEYHKHYIEKLLSGDSILGVEDLKQLGGLYNELKRLKTYNEKENLKKNISSLQSRLREQIVESFKEQKTLFKKDFLDIILPEWLESADTDNKEHKKEIVAKFKGFSTYLTGFYENRKNMYSEKEQSTAISHRIINENFPKFSANKEVYDRIKKIPDLKKKLSGLKHTLKKEFEYFEINDTEEVFKIDFFNKCLSQEGIEHYNAIVGGKSLEGGKKIQGLNEIINRYCQEGNLNGNRLPKLQPLYKQILNDRESHSFLPAFFEDHKSCAKAIDDFWKRILELEDWDNSGKKTDLLSGIKSLFLELSENHNELDKIYFEREQLSYLSNELFKDWRFIQNALEHYIENNLQNNSNSCQEKSFTGGAGKIKQEVKISKLTKKEKKDFLKKDFFSFREIHNALVSYREVLDKEEREKIKSDENSLLCYFQSVFNEQALPDINRDGAKGFLDYFEAVLEKKKMPDVEKLRDLYNLFLSKLSGASFSENQFSENQIKLIKIFLDSIQGFLKLMRPVYLEKDKKKIENLEKDSSFYSQFDKLYEKLVPLVSLYNKCRNFIATNKSRLKKIKINFEDSTLLDGWDVNKEKDNLSIIFRRKEKGSWMYYLGVMNKNHRNNFDYQLNFDDYEKEKSIKKKGELRKKLLAGESHREYYEKINYKLLPGPNKMLPKVFFSKKNLSRFNPPQDIQEIRKNKTFAKNDGEKFNLIDCHKLIDFYKKSIDNHYDWKRFNFKFSPTNQYKDISDFYYEVSSQGYKLSFDKIKADYIEEKVKTGELYLFKIYNKDFSEHSSGKPNLHTSYFRLLFKKENLGDTVFKMNGKAEIFYRKASRERKITHKKNEILKIEII